MFLANLAFSFHSDISTCFVLVNIYLMQNIKKTHWDNCFSLFFHNIIATIWPKFCPKDHTQFTFFWLISNEICWAGDSININNLCFNQAYKKKTIFKRFYIPFFRTSYTYSSEKKVKPLKNCFFEPNLQKIEVILSHTLNGKQFFFGWNNYRRSLAFRNVLFYQNIKCLDWILS